MTQVRVQGQKRCTIAIALYIHYTCTLVQEKVTLSGWLILDSAVVEITVADVVTHIYRGCYPLKDYTCS
jgi:hypothetical protein